jgi:predicted unusual protein kinase regulating ubiquinone biosynthesis (AarF/ABC1/UbiB family)
MPKKSLKETNPYLKDPKIFETALVANILTSSAVEGIRISAEKLLKHKTKSSSQR